MNTDWGYLRIGHWREYLDQEKMKLPEVEESCILSSSTSFTVFQLKFEC
jgi:hypothetical protein